MTVNHDPVHSRFEARKNGATAVADYELSGDTLILTHTEVPPEQRGQGIADQLARAAFEFARAHKLRVIPRCPFMASWLRRHPEYQDLRAAGN